MTDVDDLERRYRRWLKWYPATFRREHEAEILGVLMAGARDGQHRPEAMECLDLMSNGLGMRLRPTLPRSDRSARMAVRLMYVGAMVELGAAITVVATFGDVRSSLVAQNPRYTEAQWQADVAGQLGPLVVAAVIAVVFWLGLAWAIGRGHRSARIAFVLFFGVNLYGLLNGLAQGSLVYARADLAIAVVLCLVQFAALVLVFQKQLLGVSGRRSGAGRVGDHLAR